MRNLSLVALSEERKSIARLNVELKALTAPERISDATRR